MLVPGDVIDQKYRILRKIGEGGMGAVFEAEATRIHRRVAIKVLRISFDNADELAKRFQLEAQAAGRIGSRHIVEVFDLGSVDTIGHFMVMEYLEGESLRSRLARAAPLPPSAIYTIAEQLLEGVAAAHGAGIVHRDLKPDNIFLVRQPNGTDFVKLLDFGISKFSSASGPDGGMGLTRTGALLGTPYYLSPEQANGSKVVDHRADIYALGVILYECLTGEVPFQGDTFNELLFKIVLEPAKPFPPAIQEASASFCALVQRAMAKDPNRRFSSAVEMKLALETWMRGADPAPIVSGVLPAELASSQASPSPDGPNTIETWANSGDYARLRAEGIPPERRSGRSRPMIAFAFGISVLAVSGVLLLRQSRRSAESDLQAPSAAAVRPSLAQLSSPRSSSVGAAPAPETSPKGEAMAISASPSSSVRPEAPKPVAAQRAQSRAKRPLEVARPTQAAAGAAPIVAAPAAGVTPAASVPIPEPQVVRTPGGRAIRGDL